MIALCLQLLPELWLFAVICALFLASLARRRADALRWLPWAAAAGVAAAAMAMGARGEMLGGVYRLDALSQYFKLAIAAAFAIVAAIAAGRREAQDAGPDAMMLLSLSTWGLMILASCVELFTLYLALELSSYSLYALIPLRGDDRRAAEAGVKYILFGAAVTALALFGLSYVMASKHTTYLSALAGGSWRFADAPLAVIGMTLFAAGFFYKLALFPFHFWCPDVYQGARNETAAFVATLPKLGAALALLRLASAIGPESEILRIFAILGALSMTGANLGALAQRDLKRLLGYSSVAHAGYVMLGLAAASAAGWAAVSFYAAAYALMNLTCFFVVCAIAQGDENPTLDSLDGLHRRSPALALTLAVAAFALVGLPPTAGFTGKLLLFSAAWDAGWRWLTVVAALNTAISIYYYLGMVRHAYTGDSSQPKLSISRWRLSLGAALAAAVLVVGALPAGVYQWAQQAAQSLRP